MAVVQPAARVVLDEARGDRLVRPHGRGVDEGARGVLPAVSVDVEVVESMPGLDGRDVTESQLTLEAVDAALDRLPAEQRAVIALVCIEGFSYKEAADITGVPMGTIMSRLARARQALHAILDEPAPARNVRVASAKTGS